MCCDPVYQFQNDEICQRIDDLYPEIMAKIQQRADNYYWKSQIGVEQLGESRVHAISTFLFDSDVGNRERRYDLAPLQRLAHLFHTGVR
ncbi:hypothetical protein CHH28_08910 [Bacterioplanes sanyensis]|uniref:Uncharacterized protein n=1 Tax=Bacterioplanes sanyensis TaxID=1249553 RepID=A0A222FKP5_9GAMM|nr:hypothetical protein CHH28_08910 [Bacterioplanes sanyensis]